MVTIAVASHGARPRLEAKAKVLDAIAVLMVRVSFDRE